MGCNYQQAVVALVWFLLWLMTCDRLRISLFFQKELPL